MNFRVLAAVLALVVPVMALLLDVRLGEARGARVASGEDAPPEAR